MKIRKAVLLLACAVSWGIAVWFAGRLWAAYPLVSVRSDVPVTGRQLEALRSALRQEDGASALVPAFWSQAEGSAESRWETCGITAILYCGEYDAVYPAVLLEGRFPAAQENGKCAVSTAAAWQLWGSEDVLGQELEIEGDICRVCGLFRSSASLALCGESLDHGFSNIEFWGGYAAPPVETVQQLLRAAGIAQQVTLYFPFPWMAALTAYALCPAGLVLLAAARTLGGRVRRGCPKETCWFVLGGAFLLALVLPALLRLLPPWITPARWSDFSYWGGLLPAVGKAIETGFSLNPCAKDVLAKWNTLGLLIAATLANAADGKLMLSRQQKTPQIYETNPPYLTDNICKIRWIFMIIAVCDPKGIAIEAIKTILYHDKGLSDRISRIYEFWNMEQLLDASRDSSFDCIVFPNYCNSHNSVVCSLSCGYNRFPLVEHDPRYTLIVRDILYWETARSLWTQYLKAIPGKEEKVKRAIRGILADYEKEERDIIYLESKNHCVLVHLDGIRQTPEGSPSFYATLDEAEHEFASSAFLRIHKSYLINGDHILQMSNYKVLLDTGMTLKGSRKYFSKAKLEFYRGR